MSWESRSVYRCPGPHWGPPGTTYQWRDTPTREAYDEAIAAGWCETLAEAAERFLAPPAPAVAAPVAASVAAPVEEPLADGAPTRAELEQKAAELGIKIDRRWGDKRLLDAIDAALKG